MKKYISLEHSIRNVITESVGVGGTDKYQGSPAGFDARYSSRKGKHAAPPSMGAQRNAALTKISQTGGPMRAEGGKPLKEKVGDDKDEQKKDKGNSNLELIKKSLVKHEPFMAQMTNPQGLAHPPLQPPMSQMAIPPAPQQAMQPRAAPLPSTTPGAVATPQTVKAEGGKSGEKDSSSPPVTMNGDQAQVGVDPSHPTHPHHAASQLATAGDIVAHLSKLLHGQSQAAAATPPQMGMGSQGHNPAPAVNEPQTTKKNWRDEPGRRTGQTQSQIPGMIQRDPGTHGPDNPGDVHRPNPGEKQKGSMGHLLGLDQKPLPRQGKAGAQSGPLDPKAPGMPSFQPPESQVDPKMFKRPKLDDKAPGMPSFQPPEGVVPPIMGKRPNTPGGPKVDEKTPGMPNITTSPDAVAPPSMGKGPSGKAAAAPAKEPEKSKANDYQEPAGPPPTGGKLTQLIPGGKAPEEKKAEAKKSPANVTSSAFVDQAKSATGADKKKSAEKPPEKKKEIEKQPSVLDRLLGKETPAQRDQYNKERDEKYKKEHPHGPPWAATPPGEVPKQGKSGTQSGSAPSEKPSGPSAWERLKGNETQAERDKYNKERDEKYKKENPGGPPLAGIFPKGGINRPEKVPDYQEPAGPPPTGGKLSTMKTPEQVPTPEKKGRWGHAFDALTGKETPAEREQYNKERDKEYKEKYPEGPPYKWVGDMIAKYGKTAGILAALWGANKLFGGHGQGGGGHGGSSGEKDRKGSYLRPKIHDSPSWDIPTSVTQRMYRRNFMAPQHKQQYNEEADDGKRSTSQSTKDRRKISYIERKPKKHSLRHRFSSETTNQGRQAVAGMDEERLNMIMREAIADAKAKRKKTEGGFSKTPVDTKPKLNPEPLDSLRGP